jgi:hypothetical protein
MGVHGETDRRALGSRVRSVHRRARRGPRTPLSVARDARPRARPAKPPTLQRHPEAPVLTTSADATGQSCRKASRTLRLAFAAANLASDARCELPSSVDRNESDNPHTTRTSPTAALRPNPGTRRAACAGRSFNRTGPKPGGQSARLHTIMLHRRQHDQATKDYIARRIAEGKTARPHGYLSANSPATSTDSRTPTSNDLTSHGSICESPDAAQGVCDFLAFPLSPLKISSWGHRWGHATRKPGPDGTHEPLNHAVSAHGCRVEWARLDSNQGPRDYESPALTS